MEGATIRDNNSDVMENGSAEEQYNSLNSQENENVEGMNASEDQEQSPLENIIPLDKLRNGWFAISGFVSATAEKIQERAVETYNSEPVQNFRRKSAEVVAPAWEKTIEFSTPVWEKTRQGVTTAFETTKEQTSVAAERLRPTLEQVIDTSIISYKLYSNSNYAVFVCTLQVSHQVVDASEQGWKAVTQATTSAVGYTQEIFRGFDSDSNQSSNGNNSNQNGSMTI